MIGGSQVEEDLKRANSNQLLDSSTMRLMNENREIFKHLYLFYCTMYSFKLSLKVVQNVMNNIFGEM